MPDSAPDPSTTVLPGIELTWLGQAGFSLRGGGRHVLVDAFLTAMPERTVAAPVVPEAFTDVDLILCTHEHIDHFDAPTVTRLAASSPGSLVVVPEPIVDQVLALGIDATRVIGARDGEDVAGLPQGVKVHALPAEHGIEMADAYTIGRVGQGPARFLGFVVELADVRIFHAGDTIWWEGMEDAIRAQRVHVALLPINGRDRAREADNLVGNLNPREAGMLAARAGVDLLVPMHWDVFASNQGFPDELVSAVDRLDLDVNVLVARRMRPFRYVAR